MPVLWLIIPLVFVNYLPVAALRGLWIGPYLVDTYGANATQVGNASMMMSLAIIAEHLPMAHWTVCLDRGNGSSLPGM